MVFSKSYRFSVHFKQHNVHSFLKKSITFTLTFVSCKSVLKLQKMKKNLHNRVNREVLIERVFNSAEERITISFYKYARIGNPRLFRDHFYLLLDEIDVLGRIYVSFEGVNAQISIPKENIELLRAKLNEIVFLDQCRLNYAIDDDGKSFFKLTIKVREKIVADGLNDATFDVTDCGIHVSAQEFNLLSEDPDTVIVDMRNHYESEVGHFKQAITPDVETFREELPVVENLLKGKQDKNILMYCTGGIRCEKASAYFKHKGFNRVFQLDGGIIEYARQVKEQQLENKFIGKNFVFDERLGERISTDVISQCHQCGQPCDSHTNCSNGSCHILFIQCSECAVRYHKCCSLKCKDFFALPAEQKEELAGKIAFNGTKFGKGRFKANRKDEPLFAND
jgi:UPF0176 protein